MAGLLNVCDLCLGSNSWEEVGVVGEWSGCQCGDKAGDGSGDRVDRLWLSRCQTVLKCWKGKERKVALRAICQSSLENVVVHGDTNDLAHCTNDNGQGNGCSDKVVGTDNREDDLGWQ